MLGKIIKFAVGFVALLFIGILVIVGVLLLKNNKTEQKAQNVTDTYEAVDEENNKALNNEAVCELIHSDDPAPVEAREQSKLDYTVEKYINSNGYAVQSGYGAVEISGKVQIKSENLFGNQVDKVYLSINNSSISSDTQQAFYDYYQWNIDRGNSVSKVEGNNLLFSLGEMRLGEFVSSAGVSERARVSILDSISTGESILLRLRTNNIIGNGGAPTDFSFACAIEAAE